VGLDANTLYVSVGDLNGDGKPDVTSVAFGDAWNIGVMLNEGNGNFSVGTTPQSADAPRSVILADMNGDGKVDIVSVNLRGSGFSLFLGHGDGKFDPEVAYPIVGTPSFLLLGTLTRMAGLTWPIAAKCLV